MYLSVWVLHRFLATKQSLSHTNSNLLYDLTKVVTFCLIGLANFHILLKKIKKSLIKEAAFKKINLDHAFKLNLLVAS